VTSALVLWNDSEVATIAWVAKILEYCLWVLVATGHDIVKVHESLLGQKEILIVITVGVVLKILRK
jgi:hypothetical protein